MATTTVSALGPNDATQRRFSLVVAGDRTAEFRSARRRSITVRAMRLLLPVLTVAVLGGYALTILKTAGLATSMPELSLRKILPQDLAMNNPRYEGFGKDGSSYTFTAKTARQDLTTMNIIALDEISGWVTQADTSRTEITATRGTFDHEASILELFDRIDVVSENGLNAKLTRATILTKESLIKSSEPVVVEFPAGTIHSNTMTTPAEGAGDLVHRECPGRLDAAGARSASAQARCRAPISSRSRTSQSTSLQAGSTSTTERGSRSSPAT